MPKEELTTTYVNPVSFYMRSSNMRAPNEGKVEIVAIVESGKSIVFRLNELQLTHLACDATTQVTKALFARLAAKI